MRPVSGLLTQILNDTAHHCSHQIADVGRCLKFQCVLIHIVLQQQQFAVGQHAVAECRLQFGLDIVAVDFDDVAQPAGDHRLRKGGFIKPLRERVTNVEVLSRGVIFPAFGCGARVET